MKGFMHAALAGAIAIGASCGDDERGARQDADATAGDEDLAATTACTASTCEALGAECGEVPDGCGGVLACGVCATGTCGGAGPNRCGEGDCEPAVCATGECGERSDGCGGVLSCGVCGGAIGAACTRDGECANLGSCLPERDTSGQPTGWQDGYCTLLGCGAASACPSGSTCVGQDGVCLDRCRPAAPDCRDGYACLPWGDAGVCVPRCDADDDCRTGQLCDRASGVCVADLRALTDVGGMCTSESAASDCGPAGVCLPPVDASGAETGFAGGYCTGLACRDDEPGRTCPAGAHCLGEGLTALCLASCETAEGCRAEYTCVPTGDESAACLPRCDDDGACGAAALCDRESGRCVPDLRLAKNIGAPCSEASADLECGTTGTCIPEVDAEGPTGYPGGYCTAVACVAGVEGRACPDGSTCYGSGVGAVCLDDCSPETPDCRNGYVCAPAQSTAGGICVPSCDGDLDCDADGTRLRRCDLESGLCVRRYDDVPVGATCTDDDACGTHGTCLLAGFVGGYCSAVGCGAASPCPSGSACITSGEASFCFDTCAGDGSCRQGYVCESAAGTAICTPGCASDLDCDPDGSARRACDTASGRCVPRYDDVPVGQSCLIDAQCGTHGVCLTMLAGFPGGYCSATPCSSVAACPNGATCHALTVPLCLDDCAGDADCRSGYECITTDQGAACLP